MAFKLDKQLQKDSVLVAAQNNIQIRLINDSRYFWVILVPSVTIDNFNSELQEIHDLPITLANDLWTLTGNLSKNLKTSTKADKINIGLIGNIVSQLHLHIVARHRSDPHWPAPVWGQGTPVPLSSDECAKRVELLQNWHRKFSGIT